MMHGNHVRFYLTAIAAAACGLAGMIGLNGCTVYVQNAPPPEPVVYQTPPPAPAPPPEVVVQPEPYQSPPADVVTVYQGDLNPYGYWVDVPTYGHCWVPNNRPYGWAPYTVGHWVYCDAGWTWVSDDNESNWGPVVYHYGSWYEAPGVGWCWVPGVTWAPAWVAWREGGGYVAWAPLPPQVVFGGVYGVEVVNRYVPADRYVYVDERYANDRNIHEHIVRNNITIINRTTNITNITIVNGRAVNHGVAVANVERATGHPVEKVEVTRVTTAEEARRLVSEGKPAIYAPPAVEQAQAKREEQRVAHQQQVQENQQQAEQKRVEAQDERQKAAVDAKANADQEKADREKAAADNRAKQEQEQLDRQKAAQEKADQEKAQREQAAAEQKAKADQEKADREKAAADAKVKQEQEQADRQKAAQEKADQQQAQHEQAAADAKAKQEQAKAAQAQAAADRKAKAQEQQQQQQQKQPPKNPPKPNQPDDGQQQQQQQH